MSSYRLTTDHPASRGGVPVLIGPNGKAYGPSDDVMMPNSIVRACDLARWEQKHSGLDPELVARFAAAGETDPRLANVFALLGAGLGTALD